MLKIFLKIAKDINSLIIFTDMANIYEHSVSDKLLQTPKPNRITFARKHNVKLEGQELEEYLEKKRLEEEEKELQAALAINSDDEAEQIDKIILKDDEGRTIKRMKLTANFPMYPYIEKIRNFDDYGEIIDNKQYTFNSNDKQNELEQLKLKLMELEQQQQQQKKHIGTLTTNEMDITQDIDDDDNDSSDDEINNTNTQQSHPKKTIIHQIKLAVNCAIQYIDFEGRSDGLSIQRLYSKLKPRQMILIHGDYQAKHELKDIS